MIIKPPSYMRKCNLNWHKLHPKADDETIVPGVQRVWLETLKRER